MQAKETEICRQTDQLAAAAGDHWVAGKVWLTRDRAPATRLTRQSMSTLVQQL